MDLYVNRLSSSARQTDKEQDMKPRSVDHGGAVRRMRIGFCCILMVVALLGLGLMLGLDQQTAQAADAGLHVDAATGQDLSECGTVALPCRSIS